MEMRENEKMKIFGYDGLCDGVVDMAQNTYLP